MVLVSDDLALLDDGARRLLDEVIALGTIADDGARAAHGPRCPDLMEPSAPRRLASLAGELDTDPITGASRVTRVDPPHTR